MFWRSQSSFKASELIDAEMIYAQHSYESDSFFFFSYNHK